MFAFSNIAILLTFLVGLLLYFAKLQFVTKILAAKTQVNVFNHSLALCLFASGEKYYKMLQNVTKYYKMLQNITKYNKM